MIVGRILSALYHVIACKEWCGDIIYSAMHCITYQWIQCNWPNIFPRYAQNYLVQFNYIFNRPSRNSFSSKEYSYRYTLNDVLPAAKARMNQGICTFHNYYVVCFHPMHSTRYVQVQYLSLSFSGVYHGFQNQNSINSLAFSIIDFQTIYFNRDSRRWLSFLS